jgi:hypothetical protein
MKLHIATIAAAAILLAAAGASHEARAHSAAVGGGAAVKDVDRYQIAFQLHPKFASANQSAVLHFSVLENSSGVDGVHAAMVMKEKETGEIVEQVPYRFYASGDVSIPYRFDENEDYVATLLTRVDGDPKHQAAPLQADFDIPVGQATVMSPTDLALMVVPFAAALAGGLVFLLRKKR